MNDRRILLLITDLQIGGTPTVVRELAIRLHKLGVRIEVACLGGWGPVADQLRAAGVVVTALNARGSRDIKIAGRLKRLIRDRRFNTVFSFLMHANAMAAVVAVQMPEVRWIQSIQTTQPWPRWHWIVQRLAQHTAEKIVVPSASVARIAREWADVPDDKIVIIPNAVDLADWVGVRSSVPAGEARPYPITFLGRLDPIKDIPTLITAVMKLAPLVHLHIYGGGADRERIEKQIRMGNGFLSSGASSELPLGSGPTTEEPGPSEYLRTGLKVRKTLTGSAFITLHGAIASPQSALLGSGMLVLPSLAEGFGLVLLEAMACGVPIVATDVPGIRDVVTNCQTGLLVPASNPTALAAAITRMVHDRALRDRLINSATDELRKRFTWETVLGSYRDLLGV